MSEQQDNTAKFLSNLCKELGIYIFVLTDISKSKNLIDSFFGAAYIVETTDSYIDLSFDWHSKRIKRRVLFGDGANELIPETDDSMSERLEEEQLKKYGGYEGLWELLSHFKDGPVTVRDLMALMGNRSYKIHDLLVMAKNDRYLQQKSPRGSYRLTEKGCEVVIGMKKTGHLFHQFLEDTSSYSPDDSPKVELKKSTYSKWIEWSNRGKKAVDSTDGSTTDSTVDFITEGCTNKSAWGTGEQREQGEQMTL
jgi:hypothetical protein